MSTGSYGGYSHGTLRDRTEADLEARRPFARKGYAMTAVEGQRTLWHYGELPKEWVEIYRADQPVYTVFSYETPIAWITRSGKVRQPDVKYSRTTTQHQYTCQYHLKGERI